MTPALLDCQRCVDVLQAQLLESQARETNLRWWLNSIHAETTQDSVRRLTQEALASPAPDLVGVIKELSAALERINGMCDVPPACSCGRPNGLPAVVTCATKALSSTREIRERIGAT